MSYAPPNHLTEKLHAAPYNFYHLLPTIDPDTRNDDPADPPAEDVEHEDP